MLTIGQLARLVGVHTSTLRFYEEQGLLSPMDRTEAGYRLYAPEAEQILRFIQRAQRLGFSLSDIRTLLQAEQSGELDSNAVISMAEERYLTLERQITERLILRHELELFLRDLSSSSRNKTKDPPDIFERLLDRVCPAPLEPSSVETTLDWLITHTGCNLPSLEDHTLLDTLRGRHVHLWQEEDEYRVLVVGHDPTVEVALRELAQLEAACHAHPAPQIAENDEGYLFTARGENAFIFARLFLALEQSK